MSAYHLLVPAAYVQMGPKTILDRSRHPPIVHQLHIIVDILPADDLHETFPCFLVSSRLAAELAEHNFTGAVLIKPIIEIDKQLRSRKPKLSKPEIYWLKVGGKPLADDFGLNGDGRLVVSSTAMQVLQTFQLDQCKVYDATNPPTPDKITADIWEDARRVAEETRKKRSRPRE
jgi:hypothetical protein